MWKWTHAVRGQQENKLTFRQCPPFTKPFIAASHRYTITQTHTHKRTHSGGMSLVYWASSTGSSACFVSVTAVELTLNPEQFSSLTHPSMIIRGSVLCPQVIGGPTNFIAIDIQIQQLLYSAKNLACFPSGLRWTGSTSSERMTEPNGASPQDGRGMQRCKPCWLDVTVWV